MNNVTLCATFAVLKHYLLLVALMWILIDGIVLLILSTVTTFSFKLRYYLVGFTILAYGENTHMVCLVLSLIVVSRVRYIPPVSLKMTDVQVCVVRYTIHGPGIDLCNSLEFQTLYTLSHP